MYGWGYGGDDDARCRNWGAAHRGMARVIAGRTSPESADTAAVALHSRRKIMIQKQPEKRFIVALIVLGDFPQLAYYAECHRGFHGVLACNDCRQTRGLKV